MGWRVFCWGCKNLKNRVMIKIAKEQIEKNWPLTKVEIGNIFQAKEARVVCKIKSAEGVFVLKSIGSLRTEEEIKRDTKILNFLASSGFFHAPRLLKTRKGEDFEYLDGSHLYLMEFVEGKPPLETVENWSKLGEITAQLHDLSGYDVDSLFLPAKEIDKMLKESNSFSFSDEYKKLLCYLPDFASLSKSIIHTDIGLHNAIEKSDSSLTLLDWDDSGRGPSVLDLGYPLICQFITSGLVFKREMAQAFYNSYFSGKSFPISEKKFIFDAALFFALAYLKYGDVDSNWKRIKFAVKNRDLISCILK